jgi:hypothetical protein
MGFKNLRNSSTDPSAPAGNQSVFAHERLSTHTCGLGCAARTPCFETSRPELAPFSHSLGVGNHPIFGNMFTPIGDRNRQA